MVKATLVKDKSFTVIMDKYLSDKFKAISFFNIIMVVYLHSYNLIVKMNDDIAVIDKGYNSFIQEFVSKGIARVSVSTFFLISGYLFFTRIENSVKSFFDKFKKRFHTILLPYLFWSIFGVLFYLTFQSIPMFKGFFTNELISDYSNIELLRVIFIKPIPYQLWFMRDLMVLVLLSPLFFFCITRSNWLILIPFFIFWFLNFDLLFITSGSLLFFNTGAFLSLKKVNIRKSNWNGNFYILPIIWIFIIFFKILVPYCGDDNSYLVVFLDKISVLIGVFSIWILYDLWSKKNEISKLKIYCLFEFTFFIYVSHEPILTIYKKVLYYCLGKTENTSFFIYIIAPILTVFSAVLTGYFLKRYFSKFYFFVTGDR